ncbi:triose-phosphate isomerase [Candidatus Saccharibacteria bacterium]|nr:MAG: triose-phosphate isomerase [Candidatus Saccharibacteria bacterium]
MGKKLIIGNWKMNLSVGESSLLVHALAKLVANHRDVEVVVAPSMLALQSVSLQAHSHHFQLAAQNLYWRDDGTFTGEVSANQLRGLVRYAIVGHSERRHIFNESGKDIRNKVQAAYRHSITPVLCVGETAGERAVGETSDVIHDQLVGGLSNITSEEAASLVIAYEPVWALSNGKDFESHETPTPAEIERIVKAIRSQVKHLFGENVASSVRVLYGGSVNTDNAASFLNTKGIDGVLVGGASLDAHAFATIVDAAHTTQLKEKKK